MFYDRKVRYLDYYENGERIKGAGFIKLEVRDKSLRIELAVTGLRPTDAFERDIILCGGKQESVLGKLLISSGKGEFRQLYNDPEDIGRTGIAYRDWKGIRISLGAGREISCSWQTDGQGRADGRRRADRTAGTNEREEKDRRGRIGGTGGLEEIGRGEMRDGAAREEEVEAKGRRGRIDGAAGPEEIGREERQDGSARAGETEAKGRMERVDGAAEPEEIGRGERRDGSARTEETEAKGRMERVDGAAGPEEIGRGERRDGSARAGETEAKGRREGAAEADRWGRTDKVAKTRDTMGISERRGAREEGGLVRTKMTSTDRIGKSNKVQARDVEQSRNELRNWPEARNNTAAGRQDGKEAEKPLAAGRRDNEVKMSSASGEEKSVRLMEDKWQQLYAIYPHIHPFGDEREYIAIGPADFVVFSSASYKAANNSFLLHGYYNYKHLILTRTERKGELRYYIGVPGNFYEREKQVAVMFGFESFECAEEPAQAGDFGYYMMRAEL